MQKQLHIFDHDEALKAIERCNAKLREIERREKATLERTRNWEKELVTTGKD